MGEKKHNLRIKNFKFFFFLPLSRTYVPSCKECYVLYAGDHFCLQCVCCFHTLTRTETAELSRGGCRGMGVGVGVGAGAEERQAMPKHIHLYIHSFQPSSAAGCRLNNIRI